MSGSGVELTIGTNTSRIFSVAEMSGVLTFLVSNTSKCTLQELVRRSRNRRSPWLSTESSVSCWEAEISSALSINEFSVDLTSITGTRSSLARSATSFVHG